MFIDSDSLTQKVIAGRQNTTHSGDELIELLRMCSMQTMYNVLFASNSDKTEAACNLVR
jgi:hypothetical protein